MPAVINVKPKINASSADALTYRAIKPRVRFPFAANYLWIVEKGSDFYETLLNLYKTLILHKCKCF